MGRELCCRGESGLWLWASGRGEPDGEVGTAGAGRDKVKVGACIPLNGWLPKAQQEHGELVAC